MQKSEDNVANTIDNQELITLTADIAASFVSNNRIGTGDIGELIASVHSALSALGQADEPSTTKLEPAVSIRSSVKPDHIGCLEDFGAWRDRRALRPIRFVWKSRRVSRRRLDDNL